MSEDLSEFYAASIFFRSLKNHKVAEPDIWEEQIIAVLARSEEEAYEKALSIALREEHSYFNDAGEQVSWKFQKIERVFPMRCGEITEGTELFSRFLKGSEAESLLRPMEGE